MRLFDTGISLNAFPVGLQIHFTPPLPSGAATLTLCYRLLLVTRSCKQNVHATKLLRFFFFTMAQQPLVGQGLLVVEDSR
jgi:hypothetical protein